MNLFLPLILALASILRLYDLSRLPISLFGDEVDVGYHAWSLITTGRDYLGNFLPSYIHSLSEWRAPLLMYVTAPFVGLFGPSTWSVRLPVALLGILGVYLIYLLVRSLFPKNNHLPLISAFVLAITPWHIHYSRAAFESTLLLDLVLLGIYLFITQRLALSLLAFALTFYTYSTANLFTPLLIAGLYIIYRPSLDIKKDWLKFIPALIITIPIAYQVLFGQAAGRFQGISIFNDQKIIDQVIVQRTDPWVEKDNTDRFFTNKYDAIFRNFISNYTSSFNKNFLFIEGDPYFRHSVGQVGEFLWPLLPFFLIGLVDLFRKPDKAKLLLLFWLLIAAFPSALTQGGRFHATRLFVMIPPICFFIAKGVVTTFEFLSNWKVLRKLAVAITFITLVYSFGVYWNRYSAHYRYESAKFWHYGYEEIFGKLAQYLPSQGKLFINNTYEPSLIRFAFFTKLSPNEFQRSFTTDNPDSFKNDYFSGFRFGENIFFGQAKNLASIQELLQPGDIYLAVQGKEVPGDWDWSLTPPEGLTVLDHTNDVYGKPLFYLVTRR